MVTGIKLNDLKLSEIEEYYVLILKSFPNDKLYVIELYSELCTFQKKDFWDWIREENISFNGLRDFLANSSVVY